MGGRSGESGLTSDGGGGSIEAEETGGNRSANDARLQQTQNELDYLARRVKSDEEEFEYQLEEYRLRQEELGEAQHERDWHSTDRDYVYEYDMDSVRSALDRAKQLYEDALDTYQSSVERYNRTVDDYNDLVANKRDRKKHYDGDRFNTFLNGR